MGYYGSKAYSYRKFICWKTVIKEVKTVYWYLYRGGVANLRGSGWKRELTVVGEGIRRIMPDTSIITIGIITEGKELDNVQKRNRKTTEDVLQGLNQLGIDKKDLRTVEYVIDQKYDFVEGKRVFRGYEVRHLLEVTATVEKVGTVVDVAIKKGATNIFQIRFDSKNRDKEYRKALQEALVDSRKKAEALAKMMGVPLVTVPFFIQETGLTEEIRPFQPIMLSKEMADTTINPGQLEIKATLLAKYSYGL